MDERILILGAAGRDFHDFNVCYRDRTDVRVVAFTATQIPKIAGRCYPAELAGPHYPEGVPILPESRLEALIAEHAVTQVVLSYSDLPHEQVMHLASRTLAAGADFRLLGGQHTMLCSDKPVVAVCAVRTGCGKSPACRYVARVLRELGKKVVVVRHPMPYGDLLAMRVQRFGSTADLDAMGDGITIEEREEYEPHIEEGSVVFAGVDYGEILERAEEEADIILWDGGNNDLPFYCPDLWITLVDPHRPGHEARYHPGEANLRAADVVLVNKVNTATVAALATVQTNIAALAPDAAIVLADSRVDVEHPERIRGKRVLLIDDGPTLTHGEMPYGAGKVAADAHGAAEIVDPRPYAVGSIRELYDAFPHLGKTIPAMGYYPEQIEELAETIRRADCDSVVIATPVDLRHLVEFDKPTTRVRYELADRGTPTLAEKLADFVADLD